MRFLFAEPGRVPLQDQAWQAFNRRLAESTAYWRPYLGAIIGQVELVECRQNSPSIWAEAGAWHWMLANPRAFANPIPYKGKLGLFEVPDSLLINHGGN